MSADFYEGAPPPSVPPPEDADDLEPQVRRIRSSDERIVAVVVHWSGFMTWLLAPLVVYLTQRDSRTLVAWHAREAFNFQATLTFLYLLPCVFVSLVFVDLSLWPFAVGLPLLVLGFLVVYETAIIIWASVVAWRGDFVRIPLNIPFIPRPRDLFDTDTHVDRQ